MSTVSSSTSTSIDVASIVSQLMAVESQPLNKLQTRLSGVQTEISAFGQLQGMLSAFQDAARGLTSLDTWHAATATSSDPTAVKAAASTGAVSGTYDMTVTKLAKRQTMATGPLANATTVFGGGTLRVQLGTLNAAGTTFTANPDKAEVPITIAAGATISEVRDAINSANAGVTASLVTDGSGVRLVVRSNDSGLSNAVRLSVTDDDGNDADASGLSRLAFDPTGTKVMTQTIAPQDAQFNVNGLDLTSASNTVSGVVENVTLNFYKEGTGTVNVTVQPDADTMRKAVDKFVSAYNDLTKTIASVTRYDPATKVAGPLQGNTTVMMIQRQLRSTLQAVVGGASVGTLSAAGLQVQRDGTLSVNSTQFSAAVADPTKLQALFGASDADPSRIGIARRLDTLVTGILGSDGAVTGATSTLQKQQTDIQKQQTRMQDRLTQIQARLTKQYTALDSSLSQLSSVSSFLTSKFNGQ
ncbi:MAG: flagellar filament capping protein FliD [Burkholderiaceae bacterium]